MYIKEIVLDGFKSYANRTVISGFDQNFNAITGLNGSGKSNILDSICFVLGISQLQNVRVNNLQELVYKQGQARVTKASVSLIFDNSDKSESPPGYDSSSEIIVTRQIIVGGRSKYLINGHSAQMNRVQSFFQSVHLNINNPHFLIMQGKITKVLAMKPLEILSMVEEAAGTKMYEIKRNSAKRVIKRKETKLAEIDRTLNTEITPLLEKLKKQKEHYLTWSSNNTEMERLRRFRVAFAYFRSARAVGEQREGRELLQGRLEECEREVLELTAAVKSGLNELQKLKEKKERAEEKDLEGHNSKIADLNKKLTEKKAILQNKNSAKQEEKRNLDDNNSSLTAIRQNFTKMQNNWNKNKQKFETFKKNQKKLKDKLSSLQGRKLGFSVESKNGESNEKISFSLAAQLMQNNKKKAEIESAVKNVDFKLKSRIEIKQKKEKESLKYKEEVEKYERNVKNERAKIDSLRDEIEGMREEVKKRENIKKEQLNLKRKMESLEMERDRLQTPFFNYRMKDPNFDDSQVFGFVAALIKLKDNKFLEAIETTAGGKLKNVVITSQKIGKQLLKFGQLEQRVTMIPLDKVRPRLLSAKLVEEAKRKSGCDQVKTALDCIDFDPKFQSAMEFVFGSTLICPNLETAKIVAFELQKRVRAVTLDGELFEPHGTLSGGSKTRSKSLLLSLQHNNALQNSILKLKKNLGALDEKAENLKKSNSFETKTEKLQLMEHQFLSSIRRNKNLRGIELKEEIQSTEKEIHILQKSKNEMSEKLSELSRLIEDLSEKSALDDNSNRDMKSLRAEFLRNEDELPRLRRRVEEAAMEERTAKEEIAKTEEAKTQNLVNLAKFENEIEQIGKSIARFEDERETARADLERANSEIAFLSKRIAAENREIARAEAKKEEKRIESKKVQNELNRYEKTHKEAKEKIADLEKNNDWIEGEKHLFGKASSDYDFEAVKPDYVVARLKNLNEQQQNLSSRINKNVLVMFDKAEQDYNSFVKKRKIVLEDKGKIEKVINDLDRKKDEVLNRTFGKVDRNFGAIFKELLPGASAKLKKVDNSVLNGIEVNVAFGGAWKDSLSELSGGQRSLLALSLILSLLLFKPAPMYILDEIDAALDLSHTQNIGKMLSSHFARAQFIVVSLKEGMFSNANTLFRVKFVNGVSAVTRVAQRVDKKKY